jgi:putative cell wall-binding protein
MAQRRTAIVAVLAALTSVLCLGAPAQALTRSLQRIAGNDRYSTSVDLSVAAFPDGAPQAVIASGLAFPDGLAAGPLAALVHGPVLLTTPDGLPPQVATELQRLKATEITVVGGPAAVQDVVLESITQATGVTPTRLAGPDRYATAAAVGGRFSTGLPLYVASGAAFPDALAGGAAAGVVGSPLLLVPPDGVPDVVTAALTRLAPTEVRVLGGAAAVSPAVEDRLRSLAPAVRRIAGNDRFATAAALAREGASHAEILLASGLTFPDALSAAGLAAVRRAPILLSDTSCAPQATVDTLRDWSWPDVTAIGGTATVGPFAASIKPCSPIADGLLAPGVSLATQVLPGPKVVHILTIDRRQGYDVRPAMSTGRLEGRLPVSEIARRWGALAAVNGDFFQNDGTPAHTFAEDGRLLRYPAGVNTVVGLDPGKTTYGLFARPEPTVDVQIGAESTGLPLDLVNDGAPSGSQLALLTPESTDALPDGEWCRAVLSSTGTPFVSGETSTRQPYVVSSAGCSSTPVPRTSDVLVAAPGSLAAERLAELDPKATLAVRWRMHTTDQGVLDVVGSNATLVFGGRVSDEVLNGTGTFYGQRAPRPAIAQRPNGDLLIVVVDGRKTGYSIGMTPHELADVLVGLGAIDGANLDGGGSSAMAVRGVLVNRPSDPAGERAVGSGLVIVTHGTGAPAPMPGATVVGGDPDDIPVD